MSRGGGRGFGETEVMKANVVEEGVEELPGGGDKDLKVNRAGEVLLLKDEKRLEGGVDRLGDGMLESFPNNSVTEEVCVEESSGWRWGRRGVTGMTVGGDTEVGKNGFMVMKGSI